MHLSALEETAWLTAYCHSAAGERFALNKAFADWLIGEVGRPRFADRLAWRTVAGVALRSSLIDGWVHEELEAARRDGEKVDFWSLGCGFDYRWDRFSEHVGTTVGRYLEVDKPDLMRAKAEVVARSPFAAKYEPVVRVEGDLAAKPAELLPEARGRTLVVVEGVIDYLDRDAKLALLAAVRAKAPRAVVILDALNAWAVRMNNKKTAGATGSHELGFSWAPERPEDFYGGEAGFAISRRRSIMVETLASKHRLLRLLPLPTAVRDASSLLRLVPAGADGGRAAALDLTNNFQ